jgi:aerobic-type carbon monoxide dehydrogenase small subunit (CoxS/CutS family)
VARFNLLVNDERRAVEVEPDTPLLWVLRDALGLMGSKYGCGLGVCGACTVHLDGEAARSCLVAARDVGAREVTTIEGLAGAGPLHACQRAWIDEDVAQCGYCQAGMIMTCAAQLRKTPADAGAVLQALDAHVCRCGTYNRVRRAVRRLTAAETG